MRGTLVKKLLKPTNWFLGGQWSASWRSLKSPQRLFDQDFALPKGEDLISCKLAVLLDSHCPQDIRYKTPWLQPLSSLTNHITAYLISTVMSFSNFSDFFDLSFYGNSTTSTTDENLSIGQFLEQPSTSALKPDWFTGSEINDYSSTNLELKDQFSTTGLFAPLPSDIVHEISKPFDGKIPIIDTYTADVVRYIQRTGKVPNVNVFTSEDDDVECVSALALSLWCCEFL